MKYLLIFLVIFTTYAQKEVSDTFFNTTSNFIGIDNTNNSYFIKNNTLYKKTDGNLKTYTNLHLGKIAHVDISNPLKILVFYKDFNTAILLDNELNELTDYLDFNLLLNKNIAYVGSANNANLWLVSTDDSSLEIWNYKTKKRTIHVTLQNNFASKNISSNYRNLWLISKKYVQHYNEYGSFLEEIKIKNIQKAMVYKNGLICLTNQQLLHYKNKQLKELLPTKKAKNINFSRADFYIINDKISFFDGKSVLEINLGQ